MKVILEELFRVEGEDLHWWSFGFRANRQTRYKIEEFIESIIEQRDTRTVIRRIIWQWDPETRQTLLVCAVDYGRGDKPYQNRLAEWINEGFVDAASLFPVKPRPMEFVDPDLGTQFSS